MTAPAMTPEEIARLPYRRCVGVMLVNPSGEVFVGQRIDNPGPAWQMPQGGIDPGESVRDAALRELEEETGIPPTRSASRPRRRTGWPTICRMTWCRRSGTGAIAGRSRNGC